MTQLPSGTVTFLFTDIEGSTAMLNALGATFDDLLDAHHKIVRAALTEHGGVEVRTEGDAFLAAFTVPANAVRAAIAMQRELAEHAWPDGFPVRVRMGLHAGAATPVDGEYRGAYAIHLAARIVAAANGGQIIVSQVAREMAAEGGLDGVGFIDLGEHRLKDIGSRAHLYLVAHPSIEVDERPLRSLSALPNNLPAQLTKFIGREQERAELIGMLDEHRLVTVTGAGGAGKTRLAQEVGAEVLPKFPDGVWFVELAPLSEPSEVPRAFASALGVSETADADLLERVIASLVTREALLIVDNCEHVIGPVAAAVGAIASRAPKVRMIATSREPLGVAGEATWRVPSLSLAEGEALGLFMDRAALASPGFDPSDDERAAIGEICERLDGIPLAIELAAARVKSLSPTEILARLEDRFRLLTGGSRTTVERHRTLRATIDWSARLLEPDQRALFERLSVFSGGFTLEAAEAVCAGDGIDEYEVLDLLTDLVDRSMVISETGETGTRYRILEMLRQYAAESLDDEVAIKTRDRHLGWLTDYVGAVSEEFVFVQRPLAEERRYWAEDENLRSALAWAESKPDLEAVARLAVAAWPIWYDRGSVEHVSAALDRVAEAEGIDDALYARAVWAGAIVMTLTAKKRDVRLPWVERAVEAAARVGDPVLLARAQTHLLLWRSYMSSRSRDEFAQDRRENIELLRGLDDRVGLGNALLSEASYQSFRNHHSEALACFEELQRMFPDDPGVINGVGRQLIALGDFEGARAHLERALELRTMRGNRWLIAVSLSALAELAEVLEEFAEAEVLIERAVEHFLSAGLVELAVGAKTNLLSIWLWQGRHDEALKVLDDVEEAYSGLTPWMGLSLEYVRRFIREELADHEFLERVRAIDRPHVRASLLPNCAIHAGGADLVHDALAALEPAEPDSWKDRCNRFHDLGRLRLLIEDIDGARDALRSGLGVVAEIPGELPFLMVAAATAALASASGRAEDGARLRGYADGRLDQLGYVWQGIFRGLHQRDLAALEEAVGPGGRSEELLSEGAALTPGEAQALAHAILEAEGPGH